MADKYVTAAKDAIDVDKIDKYNCSLLEKMTLKCGKDSTIPRAMAIDAMLGENKEFLLDFSMILVLYYPSVPWHLKQFWPVKNINRFAFIMFCSKFSKTTLISSTG